MNRKVKLQQLVNECFDGNQAKFAKAIARAPAQVNHWLTGHRALGDAGARHIEISLDLGMGYFDGKVNLSKLKPAIDSTGIDHIAQKYEPNEVTISGEGFSRIDMPVLNIVEWETLDQMLRSRMSQNSIEDRTSIFCLKVQDDTNEPKLPQGCLAEINIDRVAKPGDFVLARYDIGAPPTIKQLVIDGGRTFLKPFNARYPIITPANLEILGVVQRKIEIEEF